MAEEKKLNPLLFFGISLGLAALIWFVLPTKNGNLKGADVIDSLKTVFTEDTIPPKPLAAEPKEGPVTTDSKLSKDWSVLVNRYVQAKYTYKSENLQERIAAQLNVEDSEKDPTLLRELDKADNLIQGVLEKLLDEDGMLVEPLVRTELNTATFLISEYETGISQVQQLLVILESQGGDGADFDSDSL